MAADLAWPDRANCWCRIQSLVYQRRGTGSEAIRLLEEKDITFGTLRPHIEQLSQHVMAIWFQKTCFISTTVPVKKGKKTIGPLKYHFGTSFDIKPIIHFHRCESQVINQSKVSHAL
jgi:hypothetical protein